MPNFGYHFARAKGNAIRRIYSAALPLIARWPLAIARALAFEVYAYSGEQTLPEQVASLRSFLRHAGRPKKFTVVSDGTHSARSIAMLRAVDSCVSVSRAADWIPADVPREMRAYLANHPTGKQLAVIMNLPIAGPALYLDSDVLFFPGAENLRTLEEGRDYYLADCQVSADERLFRDSHERHEPVNTGVLFLSRKLDWSLSLSRLAELEGEPDFFTNQTMTHLTMHANGARAFDPEKYVLRLDDQFVYPDRYARDEIVLRHYVNPVRHKFWTALWP